MILAIDIGNSNVVIGGIEQNEILFTARIATNVLKTAEQYAVEIKDIIRLYDYHASKMEGSIISSVVPPLSSVMKYAIEKITQHKPLVVGPGLKTGLNIKIDNPGQLGSDLVVDAVAAIQEYSAPLMVFDMGTATTVSVVNQKEEYIGGVIMPGIRLSLEALSNRASQLPHIDISCPKNVIGKNTIECMNSGIIHGNASMLDGMIERVQYELGQEVTVIATGGLAHCIVPYCRHKITLDDNLLLKGLAILYAKNCK